MVIAEHLIKTNLSALRIWEQLIKVDEWRYWDETVEFSELEEPIEAESIGIIKHRNHEPTSFMVKEYSYLQKLVEIRKSYFGKFKLTREISKGAKGLISITQKIEILDPQSVIFSPFITQALKTSLAKSIRNLLFHCLDKNSSAYMKPEKPNSSTMGIDEHRLDEVAGDFLVKERRPTPSRCAPENQKKRRTNSSNLIKLDEHKLDEVAGDFLVEERKPTPSRCAPENQKKRRTNSSNLWSILESA